MLKTLKKMIAPRWLKGFGKTDWLEGEAPKQKPKVVFVLCVADKNGNPIRLATQSLDHLKANIAKFSNENIYYIARRYGDKMDEINAFPVFSKQMNGLISTREEAMMRLMQVIMSDPR